MFAPRYFPIRYFPPRYFPNGDSPTVEVLAVMSEITNAVVTQIEGLALSGVTDANVIRVKRPVNPLNGAAPVDVGIQVFSINQQDVGGTNERDDTAYRIGIVAYQKSNQDQDSNEDRPPLWIQRIRRLFNNKRLVGVGEVYICKVEPITTVDPIRFSNQYDVSNIVVRATTREVRTT